MKIQCNCCKEKPIYELPNLKDADLVFCKCGKLLASPKEYQGVLSWYIFDAFFDKENNFTPVEIVDEKKFIETINPLSGTTNLIFDK